MPSDQRSIFLTYPSETNQFLELRPVYKILTGVRVLKNALNALKKIPDDRPMVFKILSRATSGCKKKKLKICPKQNSNPQPLNYSMTYCGLRQSCLFTKQKNRNKKLHWWLKSCKLDSILRIDSFLRDRWEIYDLWSVGEFLFLFWAVERQLSLPNQTINYFWSFERQTLLTAHSCFYPSLNLLWVVGKNDNFWIFSHRS